MKYSGEQTHSNYITPGGYFGLPITKAISITLAYFQQLDKQKITKSMSSDREATPDYRKADQQAPLVLPKVRGSSSKVQSSPYKPNIAQATPRMLRTASNSSAFMDKQIHHTESHTPNSSGNSRNPEYVAKSHPVPSFQSPRRRVRSAFSPRAIHPMDEVQRKQTLSAGQDKFQKPIREFLESPTKAGPFPASPIKITSKEKGNIFNREAPKYNNAMMNYEGNSEGYTNNINNGKPNHGQHPIVSSPIRHQQFHRKSIGDWDFCKTIGAGSMGKVKLAKHRITGEICAVKVVPRASKIWQRQHANDPPARDQKELSKRGKEYEKELARDKRTIREGALGRIMYHPYICRMYEMFPMTNHYYMLFEYVSGGQMLDYIVSHGSLKEKQARKFCRGIASALDYCHSNNIVHRDLKIENIMISKTGDIKIIDFGLSNLFDREHLLRTYCGSLYFAAPELLSAHPYIGPEVDVWSFGVVLYVLVCGKVPFDDQSVSALHEKIKKGNVQYPQTLSYDCVSLLSRMLVVNPKNRASLREVMSHPWMTKGYNGPPSSYMPHRIPLQPPLDPKVIETIVQYELASSEQQVYHDLIDIISSDFYQKAVRNWYLRRSGDVRYDPSIRDPTSSFHPLVSIYFLVNEMLQRKQMKQGSQDVNARLKAAALEKEEDLNMQTSDSGVVQSLAAGANQPVLPFPEATYRTQRKGSIAVGNIQSTNSGQGAANGDLSTQISSSPPPQQESIQGNSLFRRLSTKLQGGKRRYSTKESHDGPELLREYTTNSQQRYEQRPPEKLSVPFHRVGSVKVTNKEKQQLALEHLPPLPQSARLQVRQHQRTVSAYTSGESQRREQKQISAGIPINTNGEEDQDGRNSKSMSTGIRKQQQPVHTQLESQWGSVPRRYHPTARGKSLGHGRKRSFNIPKGGQYEPDPNAPPLPQLQVTTGDDGFFDEVDMEEGKWRSRREDNNGGNFKKPKVLTERQIIQQYENASPGTMPSIEYPKTLFLKGFFSVQTTSTKPLPVIRYDIITVLPEMGVKYTEVKGGFVCIYYTRKQEDGNSADTVSNHRNEEDAGLRTPTSKLLSPPSSPSPSLGSDEKKEATVVDLEMCSPGDSELSSPNDDGKISHEFSPHAAGSGSTSGSSSLHSHRRKFSLGNAFIRRKEPQKISPNIFGNTMSSLVKSHSRHVSILSSSPTSPKTGNHAEIFIPKTPAPANVDRRCSRSSAESSESLNSRNNGASDMLISSRIEEANQKKESTHINTARAPVKFEIHVVKVPLIGLYGVQFKKVSGNTWVYKSLASEILKRLNL